MSPPKSARRSHSSRSQYSARQDPLLLMVPTWRFSKCFSRNASVLNTLLQYTQRNAPKRASFLCWCAHAPSASAPARTAGTPLQLGVPMAGSATTPPCKWHAGTPYSASGAPRGAEEGVRCAGRQRAASTSSLSRKMSFSLLRGHSGGKRCPALHDPWGSSARGLPVVVPSQPAAGGCWRVRRCARPLCSWIELLVQDPSRLSAARTVASLPAWLYLRMIVAARGSAPEVPHQDNRAPGGKLHLVLLMFMPLVRVRKAGHQEEQCDYAATSMSHTHTSPHARGARLSERSSALFEEVGRYEAELRSVDQIESRGSFVQLEPRGRGGSASTLQGARGKAAKCCARG
jgi:hypothetical protein